MRCVRRETKKGRGECVDCMCLLRCVRGVRDYETVCLQVFLDWRAKQIAKREQKDTLSEAERKRKGILTGREIFAEVRLRRGMWLGFFVVDAPVMVCSCDGNTIGGPLPLCLPSSRMPMKLYLTKAQGFGLP